MHVFERFRRLGIGGKLVLWFVIVALLPLVLAGVLAIRHASNTIQEEVSTNLSSLADAKTRQIDAYFSEARHNLNTLAHSPSIIDALARFTTAYEDGGTASPEYVAADNELRPFLTYYQTYYEDEISYYDLLLISSEGDVVFTVMKEKDFATNLRTGPYRDTELARTFQTAATSHVTEISDFRFYLPSNDRAAFIAVPVFQEGKVIGVIALQMNELHINKLALDYTGLGETGETVFISREGEDVVFVSPLRHYEEAAFQHRTKIGSNDSPPAQRALQGQRGSGVSTDYRGESVLAAWRYIPDIRWGIVTKVDTREAFSSSRRLQRRFLLVGLLTVPAVVLAAVFVAQSISRPIARLTEGVKRIAAGNLEERVDIKAADEVGQLADEFNGMAERLHAQVGELSEQETRITTILNSTADGIITLSEHGVIRSANAAAESLFGYGADEIVGQEISLVVPSLDRLYLANDENPGDPNEDATRLVGEPKTGEPKTGEIEVDGRRVDGNTIPLALRWTEMTHQGERVLIATVQDISERRLAEQERDRLFEGIREAVHRLLSASAEILANAMQQTESAKTQAVSVTETMATINEISQTARHSVERAEMVSESAGRADAVSQSGREAIDSTTTAMQSVRENVEATAEHIRSLAERAGAIGEITSTVNDIADRTNLLAINATIEASHAGEHGKGFSVIASEVKSLAEQAKRATKQIERILGEIQEATHTTVHSTERGTKAVAEANTILTEAEETIDSLAETIREAAQAASSIVKTAGQQAAGMHQMTQAVGYIDQSARQSLAATEQSEQLAKDLKTLGDQLGQLTES